jgi:CHAT domain-containing protein
VIGGAATERAIRGRIADARIIHLATHGFAYASDARARESFVALAADSLHDGLLSVGEILDDAELAMVADLVVLSACQTGLGDLKSAEGTIGLPRALLARGARSVLVSLWSVSDEATRLLMERFYTHWLDDADAPTKAQALQRAASDVRATEGFEHPRYWAAFQLVGAR